MRLAVTAGDPAGIGPEIVFGALRSPAWPADVETVVFADPATFADTARRLGLEDQSVGAKLRLEVVDGPPRPADFALGVPSAWTGRIAANSIERAARAALAGEVDAVVTAPISKTALQLAGVQHPGHTEMLQRIAGVPSVAMMFVSEDLRLTLATIHIALAEVPAALSVDGLREVFSLTRDTLRVRARIDEPRLAVLGLNPHAGEGGMFGREDLDVITPAVREAAARGWAVEGPFPADSFFLRHRADYDAVIAMYHDQGLIPVKLLGGGTAVNVTLGLPFLRTSVDHGTAFELAGKGTASPDSLVAAARLAVAWTPRIGDLAP